MAFLPPSPVVSDCDSLDNIDDLEAYLNAQGRLSHFPTPPCPKKVETIVTEIEKDLSDDEEEDLDRKPALHKH